MILTPRLLSSDYLGTFNRDDGIYVRFKVPGKGTGIEARIKEEDLEGFQKQLSSEGKLDVSMLWGWEED